MSHKLSDSEIKRFADAYNKYGTIRAAAACCSVSNGKASYTRYQRALELGLIETPGHVGSRTRDELKAKVEGHVRVVQTQQLGLSGKGKIRC